MAAPGTAPLAFGMGTLSQTGTFLERYVDGTLHFPAELSRCLTTIKELDGRINVLRDELVYEFEDCMRMPAQSSRQATADQINDVVTIRESIDAKHRLLRQLGLEKVRLATQATEMCNQHHDKVCEDLTVFHQDLQRQMAEAPPEPQAPPPRYSQPQAPRHRASTSPADIWAKRIQRLQPGDLVAANTSLPHHAENWIIATHVQHIADHGLFEVRDEDPDEGAQALYQLPAKHVIPLPRTATNRDGPNLPPGLVVLAVFPSTTTFYRATVVSQARRLGNDQYGEYTLEFEDDFYDDETLMQRQVDFRYVVPLPPT